MRRRSSSPDNSAISVAAARDQPPHRRGRKAPEQPRALDAKQPAEASCGPCFLLSPDRSRAPSSRPKAASWRNWTAPAGPARTARSRAAAAGDRIELPDVVDVGRPAAGDQRAGVAGGIVALAERGLVARAARHQRDEVLHRRLVARIGAERVGDRDHAARSRIRGSPRSTLRAAPRRPGLDPEQIVADHRAAPAGLDRRLRQQDARRHAELLGRLAQ